MNQNKLWEPSRRIETQYVRAVKSTSAPATVTGGEYGKYSNIAELRQKAIDYYQYY